ncbi:hypothetical protein B7Z17_02830 [Candidatus Saccharibacteria bacterium 32-49-10]|nr:MAG: hypothetical protein B7Z17_02830 [Candidatus Saccharibacteria bacterium 32-49-10]
MTKQGQTDGFTVVDHVAEIERFAGDAVVDAVIYNSEQPTDDVAVRYEQEGAYIVAPGDVEGQHYRAIAASLIGGMEEGRHVETTTQVTRSLIRHDAEEMAQQILKLMGN